MQQRRADGRASFPDFVLHFHGCGTRSGADLTPATSTVGVRLMQFMYAHDFPLPYSPLLAKNHSIRISTVNNAVLHVVLTADAVCLRL